MNIRKAQWSDLDPVAQLYDEIHDAEAAGRLTTGWLRGIYPVRRTAELALQRGDLYVLEDGASLLGAAVINQLQVDVYAGAPWQYDTEDDAVCVLHTLVISPRAERRGLGSAFVHYYEDYARAHGCAELRIDTNARNLAARKLYKQLGYQEIAVVPTVFNGIPDVDLVLLEKHLFSSTP